MKNVFQFSNIYLCSVRVKKVKGYSNYKQGDICHTIHWLNCSNNKNGNLHGDHNYFKLVMTI